MINIIQPISQPQLIKQMKAMDISTIPQISSRKMSRLVKQNEFSKGNVRKQQTSQNHTFNAPYSYPNASGVAHQNTNTKSNVYNQNLMITNELKQAQNRGLDDQRIINNKLKGNKIYMSQYRQKQQLKHQSINHNNVNKMYLQNVIIDDSMGAEQQGLTEGDSQYARWSRPKTGGFLSADSTIRRRRKERQLTQHQSNTMMLVNIKSPTVYQHSPTPVVYDCSFFKSQNLDTKMNQYMNFFIKTEDKNTHQSQKYLNQLQMQIKTEGMLPHNRKINNFQRKMKIRRKVKSQSSEKGQKDNSNSLSVNRLNKTIQAISNCYVSPLVAQLELKTIFGPSNIHSTKSIRGNYTIKQMNK